MCLNTGWHGVGSWGYQPSLLTCRDDIICSGHHRQSPAAVNCTMPSLPWWAIHSLTNNLKRILLPLRRSCQVHFATRKVTHAESTDIGLLRYLKQQTDTLGFSATYGQWLTALVISWSVMVGDQVKVHLGMLWALGASSSVCLIWCPERLWDLTCWKGAWHTLESLLFSYL